MIKTATSGMAGAEGRAVAPKLPRRTAEDILMNYNPVGLAAIEVDALPVVQVGPGCSRIDIPARDGVRIWIVDIEAGATWPRVDEHDDLGEDVFVVSGELIEGDLRHAAGTYLNFGPCSSHRPRSETGVRLFGLNLTR